MRRQRPSSAVPASEMGELVLFIDGGTYALDNLIVLRAARWLYDIHIRW